MKKLILSLSVLMGLIALSSPSYALRAGDSSLRTMLNVPLTNSLPTNGAFISGNTGPNGIVLSIPGIPITGIAVSNGATVGVITIYDANTAALASAAAGGGLNTTGLVEVGPAEVVFEVTAPANTGTYYDLSNSPINTNNGVVVLTSGTAGAVVYTGSGIFANH